MATLDGSFVLVAALTLWSCARSFALKLESASKQLKSYERISDLEFLAQWTKIDEHYRALQKLSTLVNNTFGPFFGFFLVVDILYYSTSFNGVFVQRFIGDWVAAFRVFFFFCNTASSLLISANIVTQVGRLQDFLRVNRPAIPSVDQYVGCTKVGGGMTKERLYIPCEHLQIYLNDLTSHSVAMKAANVFPVTYALVANVSTQLSSYTKYES